MYRHSSPIRIVLTALLVSLVAVTGLAAATVGCGSDGPPPPAGDNDDNDDDGDDENDDDENDENDDNADDNALDPIPVENACTEGETLCADECVDTTVDPRHCGECGESCPEAHLCEDGQCVAHSGDCPAEQCTGFTYCEGDTGLCRPGCYEDAQCTGGRICDTSINSCVCPEGQRLCGGACFDQDSPDACGAECLECPDGAGTGEPVCAEGECDLLCDDDQLACDRRCADCPDGADEVDCDNGQCIATSCTDDDQRACSGDCVDCPEADEVACDGDQCIADDCPDGQLPCGGECADCPDDADEHACDGDQCIATSCSADDQRACGGDCVDCPDGADEHACDGDQCIATSCSADDRRACGGDCVDCPDGADDHTCDNGQCIATSCADDNALVCDGVCPSCPALGAGEPGCDGDECVMSACTSGFECPEYGCCTWETDLIEDDLLTPSLAPVFVRDGTAYSLVTTDSVSSVYGTQTGDSWDLQTAQIDDGPDGGVGNRPPAVSHNGQSPLMSFIPGGEDVVFGTDPTAADVEGRIDDVPDQWIQAIAAGADDDGHFVMFPSVDEEFSVARQAGGIPGTDTWFTSQVVDADIETISDLEAVVDDEGDSHGVLVEAASSTNLFYVTNESGSWETEGIGIAAVGSQNNERRTASIAVDDHPVIAHASGISSLTDELNFQEFDGTDWQETTGIDDGGEIREVTVEIDAAGHPHILYRFDDEVRHAWRYDGEWNTALLDSSLDDEDTLLALYALDDSLQALVVYDREELYHLQPVAD